MSHRQQHAEQSTTVPHKTLRERALHATLFEIGGVILVAPLLAWLMDHSLAMMGIMTVMISTIAMLWNMLYNALFDRFRKRCGFAMNLMTRVLHAMGFEAGLILAVVPLAAWWLSISLLQAFLLDIGLLLMFLPYTLLFNWAYDRLRERLVERRESRCEVL
ncbi:multidrug/biocide efflux PACE transporter [Pseudomonas syringae]|uniref:Multidrug/biocide efflux PACE transporter n=1 Tax=Pseudomonas syringae TaxID=317 RepID=A0A9Q4A4J8_PSESX|nr:multidrug/biocide efflux PACE transporter [Pseudomonas syringae]MCF5470294.1 multidrug/biocide efflux PACE transporter [Pseudomonas syringae]MCF5473921.1 multidrug/biocide efflux PACE transporter [Pseudomonas syringae]MCF5483777.1 multidrug/biocide efflux PACE transporter [Pseudomonas syringae]MCF5487729.1 multidrug/biocide efflux PACE transporter [Pseudomonas syringae]MCF5492862.1 multidrug/biocide efflux PACE transporter [Pseudomonas syringae]